MKKFLIYLCIIVVLSFTLVSCKIIDDVDLNPSDKQEITNEDEVRCSLEDLKLNSDICMFISTVSQHEVVTENGVVQTIVGTIPVTEWQVDSIEEEITITESDESCLEPKSVYIVFLSKNEQKDNTYFFTDGKSGVFKVERGDIKPLDYSLKKDVKTLWNNRIEGFDEWFAQNYKEPQASTQEYLTSPENTPAPEKTTSPA